MTDHTSLPAIEDAGLVRLWQLPTMDDARARHPRPVTTITIYGRFLGMGSSHAQVHAGHIDRFIKRGTRCNACRWFEVRIFREILLPDGVTSLDELNDPHQARLGEYLIHSTGMSIVDGELPLYRHELTASPFTVIEAMTTRRTRSNQPAEAFLAKPAARALAESSANDQQLAEAYINRAVS